MSFEKEFWRGTSPYTKLIEISESIPKGKLELQKFIEFLKTTKTMFFENPPTTQSPRISKPQQFLKGIRNILTRYTNAQNN